MHTEHELGISRRNMVLGASAGIAAMAVASGAVAAQETRRDNQDTKGELAGKRALVTGASRGIGAAIALALADKGADVVITYLKSTDKAAAVVRAIEEKGGRGMAIQADSGDSAAVKRSVEETVAGLGGLDILVNNVGNARFGAFTDLTLADIDTLLAVNVRAAVLATQAAIPHLGQGGRIITTGSNAAERAPFTGIAGYSLTKSALLGLTRHLARELGPQGITINLVQPGPTDTDLNPDNGSELALMNRRLTSLGRYGEPADIAAVVAFLASPASSFMTGSVVTVDGGYNA
ncbi:NAD(P)-dependent dehydrogenase (short-subunit alcohol dehydrogenase family) [Shinella sp. BE166]|uniref:SDR family NAD(P)-dependent oxidoreductase n=1 Tax=Shinella sp. BE166 TaxID=3373918 RepID=UPI003EC0A112